MSEIIPVSSIPGSPINNEVSPSGSGFGDFLSGAASSFGDVLSDGMSSVGGGLGMSGDLFGLIEMQRQLQLEMETVSMISNIDKSRHESRMAAIRNIRTS
jgi:hypothetical protein